MQNINLKVFDGSEIIAIAAAIININHPVIERGENAVTTEDEVYENILAGLALHGIKCHDWRHFSDKLYNYEDEPFRERFFCNNSDIIDSIIMYLDRERSTGNDVVCVRVMFKK